MIKALNANVCRPITKDIIITNPSVITTCQRYYQPQRYQVSAILLADKQDYITSGFTKIQYNKSLNFEFQLL